MKFLRHLWEAIFPHHTENDLLKVELVKGGNHTHLHIYMFGKENTCEIFDSFELAKEKAITILHDVENR